jgi:hypothetical protein
MERLKPRLIFPAIEASWKAGGRGRAGFRFEIQPTEHLAAEIILHCPVSRDGHVVVKLAIGLTHHNIPSSLSVHRRPIPLYI